MDIIDQIIEEHNKACDEEIKALIREIKSLRYLKVDASVTSLEDATINGKKLNSEGYTDTGDFMPFMQVSEKENKWNFIIDLNEKRVCGWPEDISAHVLYKVEGKGFYSFLDENKKEVVSGFLRIPTCLTVEAEYFGDGDSMNFLIKNDGTIPFWSSTLTEQLFYYFKGL